MGICQLDRREEQFRSRWEHRAKAEVGHDLSSRNSTVYFGNSRCDGKAASEIEGMVGAEAVGKEQKQTMNGIVNN